MNGVRRSGQVAGHEQAVNPPQVFTYRPFGCDCDYDASSLSPGRQVVDETIGAQVDATFPTSFLQFLAVASEQRAFRSEPRGCSFGLPFLHELISS